MLYDITTVTAYADEDLEIGDAVYFSVFVTPNPRIIHVSKPPTPNYSVHGACMTDTPAGGLATIMIAIVPRLSVKVEWTGDLLPGSRVYPCTTPGILSTTNAFETNQLGIYVGSDVLPASMSGSRIDVNILRVAPHIDV